MSSRLAPLCLLPSLALAILRYFVDLFDNRWNLVGFSDYFSTTYNSTPANTEFSHSVSWTWKIQDMLKSELHPRSLIWFWDSSNKMLSSLVHLPVRLCFLLSPSFLSFLVFHFLDWDAISSRIYKVWLVPLGYWSFHEMIFYETISLASF